MEGTRNVILFESKFQRAHEDALAKAIEGFESRRNRPNSHDTDEYKSSLIEAIEVCFDQLKEINQSKIKAARHRAGIVAFDTHMAGAWDPKRVCLHPGDLEEERKKAERKAMAAFIPESGVTVGKVFFKVTDEDKRIFAQVLQERYMDIKTKNDAANANAVSSAVNKYSEEMCRRCGDSRASPAGFFVTFLVLATIPSLRVMHHAQSMEKALELFYERRRASSSTANDEFLKDLQEKIAAKRRDYN